MKHAILRLIEILVFVATFAWLTFYGLNKFYDLKEKEYLSQISFQCAQSYRYTKTVGEGSVVSYPMEKEYKDCVKSAGDLN